MDKFTYGQYDATETGSPYNDSSYITVASEQEARKQLGYPLTELKDFINNVVNIKDIDGTEKVIQFKLTGDNLIQYSLDGETWLDTASGGHQIYDEEQNQLPQKTKLMFRGTSVHNSGDFTVVEGIQGEQGVSVSSVVQTEESSTSGGLNKWTMTLSNGNTYDFVVLNGQRGEQGETGEMGRGLIILGTYSTLEDLQQAHPTGSEGDLYIVGTGDSNPAYIWDTNDNAWESIGKIRGEKGAKGDTGDSGSAGTGIQSIVETTHSSVSGGENIWTVTLTNGATNTFSVYNGAQGEAGTGMISGGTQGQFLVKHTDIDYDVEWADMEVDQTYDSTSSNAQSGVAVASGISAYHDSTKQDTLVSGTSIKTINGSSILGSGDISTGSGSTVRTNISVNGTPTSTSYQAWDTEHIYGYKKDVTINGLTSNTLVQNIVMTDTLMNAVGYMVTTSTNTLTFYTKDNTALSGTILTLVTSEVS